MSLSANVSARSYTARAMFEAACRRAGVTTAKITAETVQIALDTYNTMFTEMLNLGIQLWARDYIILPLYLNQPQVPTPTDTSVILMATQRYQQRVTADSVFTTEGGTASFAFDDDFATACTQINANGTLGALFATETQVTTIGILFGASGNFSIFFEYTLDGSTWIAADAMSGTVQTSAETWWWKDITGAPAALGWRIRQIGIDPLVVRELFIGNQPTEIPIGVWSLDDYNAMPVKSEGGPPWNWYQDRQLATPVLYVWPVPNEIAKYYQIGAWRRRFLAQVTNLTQTMDLSKRWYEAITWSLARRLCAELPEADMARYELCKSEETSSLLLAAAEERDPAPIRFNPQIDVYTRS